MTRTSSSGRPCVLPKHIRRRLLRARARFRLDFRLGLRRRQIGSLRHAKESRRDRWCLSSRHAPRVAFGGRFRKHDLHPPTRSRFRRPEFLRRRSRYPLWLFPVERLVRGERFRRLGKDDVCKSVGRLWRFERDAGHGSVGREGGAEVLLGCVRRQAGDEERAAWIGRNRDRSRHRVDSSACCRARRPARVCLDACGHRRLALVG